MEIGHAIGHSGKQQGQQTRRTALTATTRVIDPVRLIVRILSHLGAALGCADGALTLLEGAGFEMFDIVGIEGALEDLCASKSHVVGLEAVHEIENGEVGERDGGEKERAAGREKWEEQSGSQVKKQRKAWRKRKDGTEWESDEAKGRGEKWGGV